MLFGSVWIVFSMLIFSWPLDQYGPPSKETLQLQPVFVPCSLSPLSMPHTTSRKRAYKRVPVPWNYHPATFERPATQEIRAIFPSPPSDLLMT